MKLKRNYNFKDHAEAAIDRAPEEDKPVGTTALLSGIKLGGVGADEFKVDKMDEADVEEWGVVTEESVTSNATEEEKAMYTLGSSNAGVASLCTANW